MTSFCTVHVAIIIIIINIINIINNNGRQSKISPGPALTMLVQTYRDNDKQILILHKR